MCGKTIGETQEALSCDLCSKWDHVCYVRQRERPSEALYQALADCNTRCLMYVCSCCRQQGPVVQGLFQYKKETACANVEWLASARLLEEHEALIRELQIQNAELLAKHTLLQSEVLRLTQQLIAIQLEPKSPKSAYEKVRTSVRRSLNTTANSEGSGISSGLPSLVDSGSEHSFDNMD